VKFFQIAFAMAVAGLFAIGCGKVTPPPPAAAVQWEPTAAQPRLATTKLWIGPAAIFSMAKSPADRNRIGFDPDVKTITAEMALTEKEIMTGMMFRTNIVENEGMVFNLRQPQRAAFWMKNCPRPLACAYIDPLGVILEIREMEANNTNSIVANSDNVMFVLETAQGWFERHGIRPGMVIQTESGPLINTLREARQR
jgi:uncharacterized membrane protein (UPF0127 family)